MSNLNIVTRILSVWMMAWLCLCPAQGGLLTTTARETFELIARKAAKETTEAAAERTAARLLKECGDTAACSLVKKYGDDAARILCKPERVQLFDSLGDDAAEALIKHGSMAERLLLKSPEKETAQFLALADKQTVRQTEILMRQYAPTAQESSKVLRFITKHPKIVAASALGAGAAITIYCNQDTWWGKMLLCVWNHPYAATGMSLLFLLCLWRLEKWVVHRCVMVLRKRRVYTAPSVGLRTMTAGVSNTSQNNRWWSYTASIVKGLCRMTIYKKMIDRKYE